MFWRSIAALLCASIIYAVLKVRSKRAELTGAAQPPVAHWLLGNIPIIAQAVPLFPKDVHFQQVFNYIQNKYNMPSIWYLDLWPVSNRFCFINDPVLASQYVTTTQSLPKADAATNYLDIFLGKDNMLTVEGAHWKSLRAIYNPGFNAAHLMTLVPYMVDSTLVYIDLLREKARTNELFRLEELSTRLTIDIIGKVALDADFNCQLVPHPLSSAFRERTGLMPQSARTVTLLYALEFRRIWRARQNRIKLDRLIGLELDRAIAKRDQRGPATSSKDRKRSIIDLALDAYQQEKLTTAEGIVKPGAAADATFRQEALTAIKTFLFAGHDTTSSTVAYALYLIHHHPDVHKKLIDELHAVYGADISPAALETAIKADSYTTNSLTYLNATIKEALRIFPPASTLRQTKDPNLTIPNPDPSSPLTQLPLAGCVVWPIAYLVHRNPLYFPQPTHFIPDRFIQASTPFPYPQSHLFTPSGKDAFRAFERGPRTCIGEQLAMLELRVVLAMVLGAGVSFVAEVAGPEDGTTHEAVCKGGGDTVAETQHFADRVARGEVAKQSGDGRIVEGYEIYQMLRGAGKPAYGMPGRVYFEGEGEGGDAVKAKK